MNVCKSRLPTQLTETLHSEYECILGDYRIWKLTNLEEQVSGGWDQRVVFTPPSLAYEYESRVCCVAGRHDIQRTGSSRVPAQFVRVPGAAGLRSGVGIRDGYLNFVLKK